MLLQVPVTMSLTLAILFMFTQKDTGKDIVEFFASDPQLMSYLISLLCFKQTCYTAMQFLEDLLQAMPNVFNLTTIGKLMSVSPVQCNQIHIANTMRL